MRYLLVIFACLLAGVASAEYVDSTASISVNCICNIYSSVGGGIASGVEWMIDFADAAWAGHQAEINGRAVWDSVNDRSDDLSPTLLDYWGYYENPTHWISGSDLDICILYICDSLVTAGWPNDIYERLIVHVADDSVQLTYSDGTRVVEGGSDSLNRFPIQRWYNTCPGDSLCPTGHGWIADLVWDSGVEIMALSMHKFMDTLSTLESLEYPITCLAWDNMLIGSGSNSCYGVNQSSYWSPNVDWDSGGSYPGTNTEWDACGRADDYNDYCAFKQGYYDVLEQTADLSAGAYKIWLNISNTPRGNLDGYAEVGNDSISHFGAEGRGGDLLYNAYGDAAFQLVINDIDSLYEISPLMRYELEYRVVSGAYDDRDVYNPGSSGSQTIAWGNYKAVCAFACQLCVQKWDTTTANPVTHFNYGRAIYTGGKNDRWYLLFSTDLGKPTTDWFEDSTQNTNMIMFRAYTKGVAVYAPSASAGGDTTDFSETLDLGEPVYSIEADSTRAVDSTYDADGVVTIKSSKGYVFLYEEGGGESEKKKFQGSFNKGVIGCADSYTPLWLFAYVVQ